MSLFLTSDETYVNQDKNFQNKSNSRTNFSNYILPDFFQDAPFNLALTEVYFDPNFPSLANLDSPHVITLARPSVNKLADFPQKFQDLSQFRSLFFQGQDEGKVLAPMRVHTEQVSSLNECSVKVEFHPRLNFAFSLASAKDVSMTSKTDMIQFLNLNFFPLHKNKPLKMGADGKVTILSDTDMYMSKNILNLLGFQNFQSICTPCPVLKFPNMFQYEDANLDYVSVHKDALARIEEESDLYSNYRHLIRNRPKGEVVITYKIDGELLTSKVEFELELFQFNEQIAYDYDRQFERINFVMREQWLTEVIKRALVSLPDYTRQHFLKLRSTFKTAKRYAMDNISGNWGGLITLERHGKVGTISQYHGNESMKVYNSFANVLKDAPAIVRVVFEDVFLKPKVQQISVNETFGILLNIDRKRILNFDASEEIVFPQDMNYFKCARSELAKSFSVPPHSLQIMTLCDEVNAANQPNLTFKTEKDNFFHLQGGQTYMSDSVVNLQVNYPKLIFVKGNFVNHTFYGSRQEKILNFFPVNQKKNEIIYHNFENPIRINISADSNFHIKLLDENLEPLNAGFGVPTLLSLKKSKKGKMFPVTIISSDHENIKLYPSNKSNSFTNKLGIPLLFSDRTEWTVSLRCIAFPKICNIYPEPCNMTLVRVNFGEQVAPPIKISLKSAYINNIDSLISYINQSITDEISKYPSENEVPRFKRFGQRIALETKGYDCSLTRDMIKLLGLSYSYLDTSIVFDHSNRINGVTDPDLFIFQPQEIIVLSNIVEESFYAQSRPNILRIIPIPFQEDVNVYNYVQFQNMDKIPITLDRISDIKIDIITRKGEFVNFIDQNDVKVQLEFEKKKVNDTG